jgi:polysaccharide deacetylase family protein (PEP-CTERM system associated)
MNVPNAFTVDLEDWFHGLTSANRAPERWPVLESRVVGATRSLLTLLRAYSVKATFFTLGCVAEDHPKLIEAVAADGHELAVHGHRHRFVNRLSPAEFAYELEAASAALQRITGQAPAGHRAPYFSIDGRSLWALDALSQHGFTYDSSLFPVRTTLYGYAGAERGPGRVGTGGRLAEFPVSTVCVGGRPLPFAGGFYMRTLPYPLVRWAVRRVRAEGLPVIFYLHPWELDLEQPMAAANPREQLTHYGGRRRLRSKLERLFSDFRFGPLASLLEMEQPV